jgi:hypothetical protein
LGQLVLYYKFDQGEVGQSNLNELGLYNSATSKWSAGSSTSLQTVQNTALVYAVALGGF